MAGISVLMEEAWGSSLVLFLMEDAICEGWSESTIILTLDSPGP